MRKYLLIVLILLTAVTNARADFILKHEIQPHATVSLPPAAYVEVNLTWDAPSSSPDPVAGYNVYRAQSGISLYTLLNSTPTPLTPTAYTDLTVMEGNTYDYVVESVDANGVTSLPSNMASVILPGVLIPTPFVIGNPTAH